jgi:transcriptional repressor NrdR
MRCPLCRHPDTRVIDSRLLGEGEQVRRRRECIDCKGRFTTFESAELGLPRVTKRDGRREPFSEDKLRGGLIRALEKRPIPVTQLDSAVAQILRRARASGEREIPSRWIGDWVMAELRTLDQVAYVRFASVYRSFEDVRAFVEEVQRLEHDPPPRPAAAEGTDTDGG